MTLAADAPADGSQYWNVTESGQGTLYINSAVAPTWYWNLRASQGLLGTYAGSSRSINEEFYLTKKKEGGEVEPEELPQDAFPAALHVYLKDGRIEAKPFRGNKLFRIPQLAVHLNRGVNQDGLKVNPQTDFEVLWKAAGCGLQNFRDALAQELAPGEVLLDFDVQFFDAQPANAGGMCDEWVYSGRIDNLTSCHAIAEAIVSAGAPEKDIAVAAFFNNEEVGSETREGAGGNFLKAVLENLPLPSNISATLSDSFALSIDVAHATHPNNPEKHEPNHAPILGGGIVLKTNSQKRYASDVMGSARLRDLCACANVPLQVFVTRNDMPCGSTVGPTVSAMLGIPTVDIGEPILSMHSIREMMAIKDHESMIRLVSAFFC
jgi:aspartyl aminopeptidase